MLNMYLLLDGQTVYQVRTLIQILQFFIWQFFMNSKTHATKYFSLKKSPLNNFLCRLLSLKLRICMVRRDIAVLLLYY